MAISREQAKDLTNRLLLKHGLSDWKCVINDRTKTRFGLCIFESKVIELSGWMFDYAQSEIEDTIRHEIAHAIAGYKAGHSKKWKDIAIKLGARPYACVHSFLIKPPYTWELRCTKCGDTFMGSYRKRTKVYISDCCQAKCENVKL